MQRFPIKYLRELFGENAEKAREILRADKTPARWSDESEGVARLRHTWRHCAEGPSKAEIKLAYLNDLCGGFGVEHYQTASTGEWAMTINTGDTYNPTVTWFRGRWFLCDLGEFVEKRARVAFM